MWGLQDKEPADQGDSDEGGRQKPPADPGGKGGRSVQKHGYSGCKRLSGT